MRHDGQQKYGHEYLVVIRADIDPGLEPPPAVRHGGVPPSPEKEVWG
jgi:hypothetical protein